MDLLPWVGVASSLLSAGAVAWLARKSLAVLEREKRKPPDEAVWRTWVAEGWTLAESSSARSQKENKTRPESSDKRATAIAWVRQQAEGHGLEWGNTHASHAAKLLELHHHRQRPPRLDSAFAVVPNPPR